jgi:hypothetical protein
MRPGDIRRLGIILFKSLAILNIQNGLKRPPVNQSKKNIPMLLIGLSSRKSPAVAMAAGCPELDGVCADCCETDGANDEAENSEEESTGGIGVDDCGDDAELLAVTFDGQESKGTGSGIFGGVF